ncbi:hypothetical protein NUSPORA_02583 [Nucleospora cyclopteri]
MDVLDHISQKLTDVASIKSFLNAYKIRYNGNSLNIEQADEILEMKTSERDFFQVTPFKFKHRNFTKDFEFFKQFVPGGIKRISLLKEDGECCKIFGIFYRGKNDKMVIEDEHDFIELNLEKCKDNLFLAENMFVCVKGTKEDEQFYVINAFLPKPPLATHCNKFLEKKPLKICFFSNFTTEDDFIKRAVKLHTPNLIVMSVRKELNNKKFHVPTIICRTENPACLLPVQNEIKRENISCYSHKTNKSFIKSTNPCLIEIYDKTILFLDYNICKYKEEGVFLNENPLESFIRGFISQLSANPFSKSGLRLKTQPDFIILAQNVKPFVLKVDNTIVISIPYINKNGYGIIKTDTLDAEVFFE